MSLQSTFADAIFDLEHASLNGLISSAAPASRFAVYRNNVLSSLNDALADGYPEVVQLVGAALFKDMARAYVHAHPSRSRLFDGERFAVFIDTFELATKVPYLADVARLERLCVRAYHADDIETVSLTTFAKLMARPERLVNLRLTLHPSLSLLESNYAVCSLWHAHQPSGEISKFDLYLREQVLVIRSGLAVEVLALDAGTFFFIKALQDGLSLGQAFLQGPRFDAEFDPGQGFALLLNKAVFSHLHNSKRLSYEYAD